MSKENPEYWGIEGQETLSAESIDELLEDYFDDIALEIPEKIEVIGYDRVTIPDPNEGYCKLVELILEYVIELLDENFSEARDGYTEATEEMETATKEYLEKIFNEYTPYDCNEVCRKTVTVKDYYSK